MRQVSAANFGILAHEIADRARAVRAFAAVVRSGTGRCHEELPYRLRTKGEITFGKETGKRIAFDVSERIQSLIAAGKDYTLAVYPGVEHGMTEYELKPDGTRVSTRFAPGYFAMMRDFIRDGHIGDHYGKAEITRLPVH